WILNAFFQGWGWPPCSKILTSWYSRSERGSWWAIWNTSHNVGGALIPLLVGFISLHFSWRYGMIIPGIIGVVLGASMGAVGSGETSIEIVAQLASALINLAIGVAYYTWFHSSQGGATLGKMAVGIKVVRSNGDRLTRGRAFGRYWAMLL
ncbi:RDD family protein, partial [Escherichia coli]|uniref:RDD family protein n=1 Tax=Escherichia coli TaxID=562 RepID=UPI00191BF7A2